ncbi:hypothetical protein CC80DRAFT_553511 [Byssothecium circinans]|uniref:Uncharacterized protein n=1 Tax=Byssothecium circinans TaxID=147558 RepID=A0A6A5THA5_9PLEO|nr:hypothetical protein CC80DRAFT_553511 [Byssothecium circinans]
MHIPPSIPSSSPTVASPSPPPPTVLSNSPIGAVSQPRSKVPKPLLQAFMQFRQMANDFMTNRTASTTEGTVLSKKRIEGCSQQEIEEAEAATTTLAADSAAGRARQETQSGAQQEGDGETEAGVALVEEGRSARENITALQSSAHQHQAQQEQEKDVPNLTTNGKAAEKRQASVASQRQNINIERRRVASLDAETSSSTGEI